METGNKIDEVILLEYLSGKIFGKEKVDVETWIATQIGRASCRERV